MASHRPFTRGALLLLAVVATFAIVFGLGASAARSDATNTNPKHFFWAPGQSPTGTVNSVTTDLIYHGGNLGDGAIGIQKKPAVYLIYWGPEWASGFTTPDSATGKLYSSKTLQTYVNSFFSGVGGSPWAGVQTQYCRNVLAGTTSCAGVPGADFITNPRNQLKGVWTDPTPVPADIVTLGLAQNLVDDPIAAEAMRASAHFKYDPDATYIVLTPPTTIGTGQPVYCGYHTQTTSIDGYGNPYRIEYAFIPFLNTDWPGLGTGGCGQHFVNQTSDAFGNGVFDGYSMVTGHEYAEAVTDPDNYFSNQDGWNDAQGSENGDKCAWAKDSPSPTANSQNITLGGHQFAVQPMWSNEAFDAGKDGCAVSR
jgi:serine protease